MIQMLYLANKTQQCSNEISLFLAYELITLFISSSFNNPIVTKPNYKQHSCFYVMFSLNESSLPEANSSGLVCSGKLDTVLDRLIVGSISSLFLDNDRSNREDVCLVNVCDRIPLVFD